MVPIELGPVQDLSECSNSCTEQDAQPSAILNSSDKQCSIRQVESPITKFDRLPGLTALLHDPVLGQGTTAELLPAKPLTRAIKHDPPEAPDSSIAGFLAGLPSSSAAGIAAPAAARVVRREMSQILQALQTAWTRCLPGSEEA